MGKQIRFKAKMIGNEKSSWVEFSKEDFQKAKINLCNNIIEVCDQTCIYSSIKKIIENPKGGNLEVIKLNPIEKSRTYTFPNGKKIKLNNVEELKVSDSGNHRLKTSDGKLHIIPTGWLHIEIDANEWTL